MSIKNGVDKFYPSLLKWLTPPLKKIWCTCMVLSAVLPRPVYNISVLVGSIISIQLVGNGNWIEIRTLETHRLHMVEAVFVHGVMKLFVAWRPLVIVNSCQMTSEVVAPSAPPFAQMAAIPRANVFMDLLDVELEGSFTP
jgi:hypothetical protein